MGSREWHFSTFTRTHLGILYELGTHTHELGDREMPRKMPMQVRCVMPVPWPSELRNCIAPNESVLPLLLRQIIILGGQFPRRSDFMALKIEKGLDLDLQHCWVCAITELLFNR